MSKTKIDTKQLSIFSGAVLDDLVQQERQQVTTAPAAMPSSLFDGIEQQEQQQQSIYRECDNCHELAFYPEKWRCMGCGYVPADFDIPEAELAEHWIEVPQPKEEEQPKPSGISNRPFTQRDIQNYNHPFRMFETSLERENSGFESESLKYEKMATDKLARYGINEIPADVQRALDRLKKARYLCWQFTTNATRKAPGAYVVGPSKYNSRRHERVWRGESKHYDAIERAQRLLDRAIGRYSPRAAVSSDDANAVEKLQAKIDRDEALQERMKAANKICQNKKLTEQEQRDQLQAMGYSLTAAHTLLNPRYAFEKKGHQTWELSNNSANTRRMKERIEELNRKRSEVEKEAENESGIRIVDNVTDNRLQIFFPGIPPKETREQLKRNGFKWSPSNGCWQRFRSATANYYAEQITGIKIS